MMWFVSALLATAALAPLLLPLRRADARSAGNAERYSIYRDQLAQLPDDVSRGTIEAAQVPAMRLEIERRMLAAAVAEDADKLARLADAPMRGWTLMALSAAVSGGAFALYLGLGSPYFGEPDRRAATAADRPAERSSDTTTRVQRPELTAAVASLTEKLSSGAGGADDWRRLARAQAELGRWADSASSYRRLAALTGGLIDDVTEYGEVLVLAAKGVVTPAARAVFDGALLREPSNMSARYYLGLADAQTGKPAAAIERWRHLEADAPSNARWLPTLRKQIAVVAATARIVLPPTTSSPARSTLPAPDSGLPQLAATTAPTTNFGTDHGTVGPTARDVEAAQDLSPDQRMAIIRSMVERLAARLATTPEDFEGWQRLARSYGVLGDKKEAAAAAERAAALRPTLATLSEAARAVLVAEGSEDPRVKLPASFVGLLERMLELDPNDADALWYLGLARAQSKNFQGASQYWRRLAASLPENSDRRKTVDAALATVD